MPPLRALWLCALWLAVGCGHAAPSRELYQWTDARGDVRYTAFPERIPPALRQAALTLEPGAASALPAPSPAASLEAPAPEPLVSEAGPAPVESPPPPPEAAPDTAALDGRIAALEARVAADQDALKRLISDPEIPELRSSPELREISERLPALQQELETLREQRERLGDANDGD